MRTLESRKKQSETLKRLYAEGKRKKKPPKHNVKHSEETKALLSKKAKERYASDWIDPKIGVPRSEETKRKISESKKGVSVKHDGQFKKGCVPKNKGIPATIEQRLVTSEAVKNCLNKACGEKHWNWKGGRYNPKWEEYKKAQGRLKWKIWRSMVFERDDYTCQDCGKKDVVLHPHHIEKFSDNVELRYSIDNGITLCNSCHIKTHTRKRKCSLE